MLNRDDGKIQWVTNNGADGYVRSLNCCEVAAFAADGLKGPFFGWLREEKAKV